MVLWEHVNGEFDVNSSVEEIFLGKWQVGLYLKDNQVKGEGKGFGEGSNI